MEAARHEDPTRAFELAAQGCETEADNLYWARQLTLLGQVLGRGNEVFERVSRMSPLRHPDARPLVDFFHGERLFAAGDYGQAERAYKRAMGSAFWYLPVERRAEALWRMDDRDAALELWREALLVRPWHASLLLRVHAAMQPQPPSDVMPPTAVLIQTRNNAANLDRTLQHLSASFGTYLITILNNRSDDETESMLRGWQDDLGQESLLIYTPSRYLEPAEARNRLIGLPQLEEMDFLALVDDDLLLPEDWLVQLHAARESYQGFASWGCASHAPKNWEFLLSTDLHLFKANEKDLSTPGEPFHFKLSDLHCQVQDRGQFAYVRPCLSTTASCRLYDMDELAEGGCFDQELGNGLDILERDFRRALQGRLCCYQGGLVVSRQKAHPSASVQCAADRAESGCDCTVWQGLMHRFTHEELQHIKAAQTLNIWQDLCDKIEDVEEGLGLK